VEENRIEVMEGDDAAFESPPSTQNANASVGFAGQNVLCIWPTRVIHPPDQEY
jgi:hypothetical protein